MDREASLCGWKRWIDPKGGTLNRWTFWLDGWLRGAWINGASRIVFILSD